MRKRNAALSLIFGTGYQILAVLLSFFSRSVFLMVLDEEYLGINSFLADIFGVLVALDFGLGSSTFLKIYKPLAEKDEQKIKSVYALVRMIYRIRGIVVFVAGSILFYFLPVLVTNTNLPMEFLQRCYLIYMVFNAASYWFIFYNFFLEAAQLRYLLSIVQGAVTVITTGINIASLLLIRSYTAYMLASLSLQLCTGIIGKYIGYHYFPYLKGKLHIEKEDMKDFKELIGMGFHCMSGAVIVSTDSLLITSMAGLGVNGLYSNYKMIVDKVNGLIAQVTGSVKDPLRDLIAAQPCTYIEEMAEKINFLYFWISGFCASAIIVLMNPFIKMVWGEYYLLPVSTAVLTAVNLYLPVLNYLMNDMYYYTRCYVRDKKTPAAEVLINLAVSFILGSRIGLNGVLAGTAACYVFQALRRGYRVYQVYFHKPAWAYAARWGAYNLMIALSVLCCYGIAGVFSMRQELAAFVCKMAVCVLVPNLMYCLVYRKTERFRYFQQMVLGGWNRIKRNH